MRLKSVYVRFYKSFNCDYLRKLDAAKPEKNIKQMPWEYAGAQFYPHVQIQIDFQITTVVGANESGKTHFLSAIEKGILGEENGFFNKIPRSRAAGKIVDSLQVSSQNCCLLTFA